MLGSKVINKEVNAELAKLQAIKLALQNKLTKNKNTTSVPTFTIYSWYSSRFS